MVEPCALRRARTHKLTRVRRRLSCSSLPILVVALAVALELGGDRGRSAAPFSLTDVAVSGIEHVTPKAVADALASGRKLRLVGGAEVAAEAGGRPSGYVRVESLAPCDPLYGLNGADAVSFLRRGL